MHVNSLIWREVYKIFEQDLKGLGVFYGFI